MLEQIWSNVKYVVMAVCVTIVLSLMIKGCNDNHTPRHKHTYEIVKETEALHGSCGQSSTHRHYHIDKVPCPCQYDAVTYHQKCTGCGCMNKYVIRK